MVLQAPSCADEDAEREDGESEVAEDSSLGHQDSRTVEVLHSHVPSEKAHVLVQAPCWDEAVDC